MEKNNLIAKINRTLPSVEGEEENLITAATLRDVLMSVYDAGVSDTLQNLDVRNIGKGNRILSSAYLSEAYSGYCFSYNAETRSLSVEEIEPYTIGQHLFVVDRTNKVSAYVIVEALDFDNNAIIISENSTLVTSEMENIIAECLDGYAYSSSQVCGHNVVVFGGHVNYSRETQPNFLTLEVIKSINIEISKEAAVRSLYVVDMNQFYRYFVKGGFYTIVDLDAPTTYGANLIDFSFVTYTLNSGEFIVAIKLDFDIEISLRESENWSIITDIINDASSELVIQDGSQAIGKVLTSDQYGKATWQAIPVIPPVDPVPVVPTVPIISSTYEELTNLLNENILVPGQYYSFEHITTHVIPLTGNVINNGIPEVLIIKAASGNTFFKEAISQSYLKHEIDYDFGNNICEDNSTPRTGWIYRRKDEFNNEVIGFDFYNVKFRRYQINSEASSVSDFNQDTSYALKAKVLSGGFIYVCIKATNPSILISNLSYWLKFCASTDYVCISPSQLNTMLQFYSGYVEFQGNVDLYSDFLFLQYTDGTINPTYNHDNLFDLKTLDLVNINTIFQGYIANNIFNGNLRNVSFLNACLTNNNFQNQRDDLGYSSSMLVIGISMSCNDFEDTVFENFHSYGGVLFAYNKIFYAYFAGLNLEGNARIVDNNFFVSQTSVCTFQNNSGIANCEISNWEILSNQIIVSKLFQNNKMTSKYLSSSSIDFSLATHVFNVYHCDIAHNTSSVCFLKYVNTDNVQVIVAPTT
ncbi:MAG: hypothetical protein WCL51_16280 [Bacteroidota bacterium]